jgi:hypothetical protein
MREDIKSSPPAFEARSSPLAFEARGHLKTALRQDIRVSESTVKE